MASDMRLVKVEWWDHSSRPNEWHALDDYKKEKPLRCVSVGWVAHEDSKVIVLVPHMYMADPEFVQKGCGDMTLVKRAIHKIKVLKG